MIIVARREWAYGTYSPPSGRGENDHTALIRLQVVSISSPLRLRRYIDWCITYVCMYRMVISISISIYKNGCMSWFSI
jgi:hypothetical protein